MVIVEITILLSLLGAIYLVFWAASADNDMQKALDRLDAETNRIIESLSKHFNVKK